MISDVLSLVILLLAATQPSPSRVTVAFIYAAVHLAHGGLAPLIPGGWYYATAAGADLVIMAFIVHAVRIPAIAVSILRVCLAEIVVNAGGWLLWFNYHEPTLYNLAFYGLNAWLIMILMRRDPANDVGGFTVNRGRDWIRLVIGSRHKPI